MTLFNSYVSLPEGTHQTQPSFSGCVAPLGSQAPAPLGPSETSRGDQRRRPPDRLGVDRQRAMVFQKGIRLWNTLDIWWFIHDHYEIYQECDDYLFDDLFDWFDDVTFKGSTNSTRPTRHFFRNPQQFPVHCVTRFRSSDVPLVSRFTLTWKPLIHPMNSPSLLVCITHQYPSLSFITSWDGFVWK